MTAVLLANAAATLFLVGLGWFVHAVHYPLFDAVSPAEFPSYHAEHSRRTTMVVVAPMVVELGTSIALVAEPPGGQTALAVIGAALAVAVWVLTIAGAAPAHSQLGDGSSPGPKRLLMRVSLVRTWTWTAHGAVVVALLAAAI